ncbi:hypothetical protein IC608_08655 [Devosia sp. PTR5]|uniref:Uncharacterized protein n=1 Tax=Devosia oryzisoli TaxID=2774138 RepID=A0A927FVS1_9HYPH|nr:hypothetical protein [Devosia oryzisoli]MBD8065544.1 hypothetical protein [Devosia oryzisoli]
MRFLIALAIALLALPTWASEAYVNARFGYAISVPEGLEGQGESDNGDGQRFVAAGRPTELAVWGGFITGQPDFSGFAGWSIRQDEAAGWGISYQASTPTWASWSGTSGGRVLYQRLIALCAPGTYAAFRLEYSQADRVTVDPVIEKLVPSLHATGC